MDLEMRDTQTPRLQQPNAVRSARRPHSARRARNPITGEEYTYEHQNEAISHRATSLSHFRPPNVPLLNLKHLKESEEPSGPIEVSLRDYKLDTPSTASTVSWGTGRSGCVKRKELQKQETAKSVKPRDVPSLSLGEQPPLPQKLSKEICPNAWDAMPVPENLPAPSARHKEMYKQYSEEMKQAYRTHSQPGKFNEEEISKAVTEIKNTYTQPNTNEIFDEDTTKEVVEEDMVDDRWKKQRYTSKQLQKKMDAEDLLEHNKKQKLIETVMIDQLSRAVISDPEQNERSLNTGRTTRRLRGTNHHLHDSKISTRSTATENLLSRRLRFGARIITRNGRDAMKELTGFFFQMDRTMTVYEFKQFGKSAKAIPFIQRGVFNHPFGPKKGLPYGLSDIFVGADINIPTKGQLTLSAELARCQFLTLRVTDMDEEEKSRLLLDDFIDVEGPEAYGQTDTSRIMAYENRQFLAAIQESVQRQIHKRGIKTVTGLGRHYRSIDRVGTWILDQHDLERGLLRFHINLLPEDLEQVFDIVDTEGMRCLDYSFFMRTVIGEMNEFRKALVRKAFYKVDTRKEGTIHLSDIKKFFNPNSPYKPGSDADTTKSALMAFLEAVTSSARQEDVTFIEFEEYYEGLSLGVKEDEDFANILCNTWNI